MKTIKTRACQCCSGDMPARDVWEANRDRAGDCTGSVDGRGRCRAWSSDELWQVPQACCAACGKDCPVAADQTDPASDEVACDVRGIVCRGEYVCGECLTDAEDA